MTQLIIDRASSIAFNRDVSIASTSSQSRRFTYFRSGPFQTIANVGITAMTGDQWRLIQAELAAGLAGPYNVTFPNDILPDELGGTPLVNGASQTDNTINTDGWSNGQVIPVGSLFRFAGVNGSYILTSSVTANGTGAATLTLDQAVQSTPADNAVITSNVGITFSMHLIEIPRVAYVPSTGVVRPNGPFVFAEVV